MFAPEVDALINQSLKLFNEIEDDVEDEQLLGNLYSYDAYTRNYLNEIPTPEQSEIAQLLEEPPFRVLVPSGNNLGKTRLMASYARYFYQKYNPSEVLITATTAGQVRDGVFKEIRSSSPRLLGAMPRATRVESAPDHYIHGYTSANPDAFQGRHGPNIAILFDEGTGIHPDIWGRAETMFGGHEGHCWLVTYNPNDPSTPPFAAEESGLWRTVRLNALEHINVKAELRGLAPPIPAAIRLNRVLDRIATECEPASKPSAGDTDSQLVFEFPLGTGFWWKPTTSAFEAQVLGRWPLITTESVISPGMVDEAFRRGYMLNTEQQLVISCDIARFGSDRTVIVVRRGPIIIEIIELSKRNSKEVIDEINKAIYRHAVPDELRYVPVIIDDTGGYGGGVVDFAGGLRVIPVNFSSKSPQELVTYNMRSHLWFNLSEVLKAGVCDISRLPASQVGRMREELSSARYRFDERGRKRVEPKVQIRQRLKRSPDIADALALSYHVY